MPSDNITQRKAFPISIILRTTKAKIHAPYNGNESLQWGHWSKFECLLETTATIEETRCFRGGLHCLRGCYRQFGARGVMADVMIAASAGVGWGRERADVTNAGSRANIINSTETQ
jgi:hypothetical protein